MDLPLTALPAPTGSPGLLLRLYRPVDQDRLPSVDAMLTVLDEDERLRADRTECGSARSAFVTGRYLLRRFTAELLDVDPRTMTAVSSCPSCAARGVTGPDHGRPGYLLGDAHVPLELSLSRSRGAVLLAALPSGNGARTGVDLEAVDDVGFEGFADVALTPAEREAVRELPQESGLLARARLWARKEALVKALGSGLTGRDPSTLDVLHDPRTGDVELPAPPRGAGAADGDEQGGLVAAVAVVPSSP
ncbi:4'-phosphopantetheinyl transferase family protein [Arthrobacter sp. RIT-PI-e]|uniref:4'-phosphopantetheinyl transferase family protein n=1 Tax=Arthrobacter sp. RIT-PI-e TaxID=1681197 RepID=UPI0006769A9D|nr:4'-phosphopantetheinyl transferase family protein [Arthrobacter sp. RIT-PI-e]